jgi:hypothetical protein
MFIYGANVIKVPESLIFDRRSFYNAPTIAELLKAASNKTDKIKYRMFTKMSCMYVLSVFCDAFFEIFSS